MKSLDGSKIRKLRETHGLSQEALARAVAAQGVVMCSASISVYEKGIVNDPSYLRVCAIADVLGVGPEELFSGE